MKAISQHTVYIIIIIALAILYLRSCDKSKQTAKEVASLNEWVNSTTLHVSELESKNKALIVNNKNLLLDLNGLSADKKELQQLLKNEKNTNQALLHRISILISDSGKNTPPTTIIKTDTIDNYIYPTYFKSFQNKDYYKADVTLGKDTAHLNLSVQAKFIHSYSWEREKGLFGLKSPVIKTTSDNPYVKTSSIESITIAKNPPKLGLGITAGMGIDKNMQPTTAIIVGVNIRIMDF